MIRYRLISACYKLVEVVVCNDATGGLWVVANDKRSAYFLQAFGATRSTVLRTQRCSPEPTFMHCAASGQRAQSRLLPQGRTVSNYHPGLGRSVKRTPYDDWKQLALSVLISSPMQRCRTFCERRLSPAIRTFSRVAAKVRQEPSLTHAA